MLMRVSIGIHQDDIEAAIKTYHMMSQRWFTHASPTLFNAGTRRPQVIIKIMKEGSVSSIQCWICFLFEFFISIWKFQLKVCLVM